MGVEVQAEITVLAAALVVVGDAAAEAAARQQGSVVSQPAEPACDGQLAGAWGPSHGDQLDGAEVVVVVAAAAPELAYLASLNPLHL